jgi:hypothetical protein
VQLFGLVVRDESLSDYAHFGKKPLDLGNTFPSFSKIEGLEGVPEELLQLSEQY